DSAAIGTVASYYMRSDRRNEALDLYRENSRLFPDAHDIRIEYISALYYLQKWEELEVGVREMMEKFPDDETLSEVLAVALWHLKDIDGAIQTYRKQLKKTDNPSIRLSCCTALGDLYQEIGELKKAEFYYKKGLAIDSEYIPLLNNYAYFLTKIGKDYQNGLKMSKKTILNEPDNPTYLDTYGWLLYLTGDYQEAKAQFKRAMLFGGKENGVIMDHYADVLWALKDHEMALIYYEQAEKLDASLNIAEKIKARKEEIGK
ncbi:MAG: tetratricopeptide repeat protein, partial [Alistipes sp.]|nr:tetratricopeptide repeat protein [Candidatus Minthomonas equi]